MTRVLRTRSTAPAAPAKAGKAGKAGKAASPSLTPNLGTKNPKVPKPSRATSKNARQRRTTAGTTEAKIKRTIDNLNEGAREASTPLSDGSCDAYVPDNVDDPEPEEPNVDESQPLVSIDDEAKPKTKATASKAKIVIKPPPAPKGRPPNKATNKATKVATAPTAPRAKRVTDFTVRRVLSFDGKVQALGLKAILDAQIQLLQALHPGGEVTYTDHMRQFINFCDGDGDKTTVAEQKDEEDEGVAMEEKKDDDDPTVTEGMGHNMDTLLTAPPYVFAAIPALGSAWAADRFRIRAYAIIFNCTLVIVGTAVYSQVAKSQIGGRYVGVLLAVGGANSIPSLVISWAQTSIRSQSKRGFNSALIIAWGGIGGILAGVSFRQQEATIGYPTGIWLTVAMEMTTIVGCLGLKFWYTYQNKRAERGEIVLEGHENFRYET